MKKTNIILIAILIISIIFLATGCTGMTALEKFNAASEKLATSTGYTMDMVMDIGSSEMEENMTSDIMIKVTVPDTEDSSTMGMAMTMGMNVMGETVNAEYYIKENVMYIGMQELMEGYLYIDLSLPDTEEIAAQTATFSADDFLVESITEENITITDETIEYSGEEIKAECLQLTITEENFSEIMDLVSAASDQVTGSEAETDEERMSELMEMLNPEDIIYKVYINEETEIIRFNMVYDMNIAIGDVSMTMSIDMTADIYDVNSTTIEYPDFTDSIDYMGLLQFGME